MKAQIIQLWLALLLFPWLVGCGEDTGGVTFAKAGGVVTYKGSPVSGAQILATPEKGPLAMALTNDEGKFSLNTNGRDGVAIGKVRLAVVVASEEKDSNDFVPNSAPTGTDANAATQGPMQAMMKFDEIQRKNMGKKAVNKSPMAKYADPATSGLSYEIKAGANEPLKVELK